MQIANCSSCRLPICNFSSSKLGSLAYVNARFLLRMACVKEDQTKEGTHAFTDELDQQFSGSSMGTRSFIASRSAESTRTRLHCGSGVEHRASRGGEDGV